MIKVTAVAAILALTICSPALAKPHRASKMTAAPTKTITETAVASPGLSTLTAAVVAAGLADTLSGPGPFTVFAPTNAAFAKLPAGTVETLLKPENKGTLTSILTYHVVPGTLNAATIIRAIKAGRGKATLTTVQGANLSAKIVGGKVIVTDKSGGTSTVTSADVKAKNGIVHIIDNVLMQ